MRIPTMIACAVVCLTASLSTTSARAEQGFVGMQILGMNQEVFKALGEDNAFGLLIRDVGLGTPAAKSGFLRGDILTEIEDEPVQSVAQVVKILQTMGPGDSVEFELLRQGEPMELDLELGEWPEPWKPGHKGFGNIPNLAVTMATMNEDLRKQLEIRWGAYGVVVTIAPPLAEGVPGLRRGDVIVQVNQQDVWLPKQVIDAYQDAKSGGQEHVLLFLERSSGYEFLLLNTR